MADGVFEDVGGLSFEDSAVGSDPDDSCESESESDELDELDEDSEEDEVEDEELEDSASSSESDSRSETGSFRCFCTPWVPFGFWGAGKAGGDAFRRLERTRC